MNTERTIYEEIPGNWNLIPEHMHDGLARYILDGTETGGFLYSLLIGDLFRTVNKADEDNIRAIPGYCKFLYNYAPMGCYGSEETVAEWMRQGGLRGREKARQEAEL